jgi:hypothetical protein
VLLVINDKFVRGFGNILAQFGENGGNVIKSIKSDDFRSEKHYK